jgi:transposase InsO family protein
MGGLHINISSEQQDTHTERTLKGLNINLILANSPQAKGRIERLFKTFQDRLIKVMRVKQIKNYN